MYILLYFNKKIKLNAFTLAEVLITLGIIGVVAAMTIPVILNNSQDTQFKSAWKKQYSLIEQISKTFLQDNGNTFLGVTNYMTAFLPYLKTVKTCPTASDTEGCWVPSGQNKYLTTYGGETTAGMPNNGPAKNLGIYPGMILADGTLVVYMAYWNATCNQYGNVCGWILFDVNGFDQPNTIGKDVYGVWVLQDRIVPIGSSTVNALVRDCSATNSTGYGCSSVYLLQ